MKLKHEKLSFILFIKLLQNIDMIFVWKASPREQLSDRDSLYK